MSRNTSAAEQVLADGKAEPYRTLAHLSGATNILPGTPAPTFAAMVPAGSARSEGSVASICPRSFALDGSTPWGEKEDAISIVPSSALSVRACNL